MNLLMHKVVLDEVAAEVTRARTELKFPTMHSPHEGYSILLEEVDELWQHVKVKQKNRDLPAMRKEAIQVAAMAICFAAEVADEINGRK